MKKIYFYNKKFAFTLAETLIVMGIIGVAHPQVKKKKLRKFKKYILNLMMQWVEL